MGINVRAQNSDEDITASACFIEVAALVKNSETTE